MAAFFIMQTRHCCQPPPSKGQRRVLQWRSKGKGCVGVQVIKFTSDRRTDESVTMWAAALSERN